MHFFLLSFLRHLRAPFFCLPELVAFAVFPVSGSPALPGEPPVAWANARLPASNIVNTTVNSFFMHSPCSRKSLCAKCYSLRRLRSKSYLEDLIWRLSYWPFS